MSDFIKEKKYTFNKKERLNGEIKIKELFNKGSFFLIYPFKVALLQVEKDIDAPVKILIATPKKKNKKATNRNLIKRLIRETYRKNKEDLYTFLEQKDYSLHLSVIYIEERILSYQEIDKKMKKIIEKIIEKSA